MRAVVTALALLTTGCIRDITDLPRLPNKEAVERCDGLRQRRDIYSIAAAGTSLMAGAGGFASIQLTGADSQRHAAELSVAVGFVGAILVAAATQTGNAYTEEGCADRFAAIRGK